MVPSVDGDGYAVVTAFGRLFGYGDFPTTATRRGSGSGPHRGGGDLQDGGLLPGRG